MTEDEAKQKWCPMVRFAPDSENGGMLVLNQPQDTLKCVASDCMMWRLDWAQRGIDYASGEIPTKGYCGLAGKP